MVGIINIGLPDMNGIYLANELISNNNYIHTLLTTWQDEDELKMQYKINNTFKLLKKLYRM